MCNVNNEELGRQCEMTCNSLDSRVSILHSALIEHWGNYFSVGVKTIKCEVSQPRCKTLSKITYSSRVIKEEVRFLNLYGLGRKLDTFTYYRKIFQESKSESEMQIVILALESKWLMVWQWWWRWYCSMVYVCVCVCIFPFKI